MKEPRQNQSLNTLNGAQTGDLVCVWTLFSVTSIVMILRIVVQTRILRKISVDDILMIIAWALQTASAVLCTVGIYWGLGRHASEINGPNMYTSAMKYEMLTITTDTLCAMFSRISLAIYIFYFLSRISKTHQGLIGILIVVQVVFNVVPIALTWVHCKPTVSHPQTNANSELCWISPHVAGWQYAQGVINATSDLCLTLLAVNLVLTLDLRNWDKLRAGMLLSFSLLAMVAAIVKTVEIKLSQGSGGDFIYRVHIWNYWYSIENAVLIITASIPKIRPLVLRIYKSSKDTQILPFWTGSRGPTGESSIGYRSLHSRNCSGSTGKPSVSVPSITGTTWESESIFRREGPKISIYNSSLKRMNRGQNHPHRHTRHLSDSVSLRSLPNSLHREKNHCTARVLHPSVSCNDFTRSSSSSTPPRLLNTCRTIISGGDPSAVPAPPLTPTVTTTTTTTTTNPFSISLPTSGRNSRNSRRGDVSPRQQQQQQSPSLFPLNIGTSDCPVLARGPFCILKTDDFTVEYEDANGDRHHDNSKDVDLGWTVMRNDDNSVTRKAYNEDYDADGLQLNDVGSILLRPSQDQV